MQIARCIFWVAGGYGLLVMVPQYLLFDMIGHDYPPAITHPEYFYGFVGLAVAWQIAFLIIGYDPQRYRPLMMVAVLEKASFAIPAAMLFAQKRLAASTFGFGMFDAMWGVLFLVAWWLSGPRRAMT